MALPRPASPVPPQSLVGYERKGTNFIDPIKSNFTDFTPFATQNVCDEDEYVKLSTAVTINQVIDCKTIPAASGSISLLLPHDANQDDLQTVINWITIILTAQLEDYNVPPSGM